MSLSLSSFYNLFFSCFLSGEGPKKPFFPSIAVYANSSTPPKKHYFGLASSL
jgi:hypothetical protein